MFFLLSNSTSRFPVQNFSTVFGLDLLDIIFSIKKGDSWSNFSGFQHVFLLSTSTSRFPVQNFSTVFGLDLLDIIFSIKKGDSWSNFSGFQPVFLLPLPQAGFQFRISVQFLGWIYWILFFRSRKVTVDLISQVFNPFFCFHFHKQVSSSEFQYSFWVGSTGYYFFDHERWQLIKFLRFSTCFFCFPLPQAGFQFRISVQFLGWIYWILFFRSRKVTVDLISQVFNMFFFAFHFHKQVSSSEFQYSFWVGSTGYYFFD